MSYTVRDFKTKKALKQAVAAGELVQMQPEWFGGAIKEGTVYLEGPHYPKPHTWYAQAIVKDGAVVRVK